MKRRFLLIEILLAFVLVASLSAPLIYVLRSRLKKTSELAQKLENARLFETTRLAVLEKIAADPNILKRLEKTEHLEIEGAFLRLGKNKIREREKRRAYLIEIKKGELCSSAVIVYSQDLAVSPS